MKSWISVGPAHRFPLGGGACVLVEQKQVAVFNFEGKEWYAVQNQCPHEEAMVLSRGLIGDQCGEPKVACPLHKRNFSLVDGRQLGGEQEYTLKTYPVQVKDGEVLIGLE